MCCAVLCAQGYEDELAQAIALSVMPLEEMRGAAEDQAALSAAMGEAPPLALEDALAQELLAWFKTSFFSWVSVAFVGDGRFEFSGARGRPGAVGWAWFKTSFFSWVSSQGLFLQLSELRVREWWQMFESRPASSAR